VQTIIALLESLSDDTWEYVSIEPDQSSHKVDILWEGHAGKKAVQVKSSINQIGKAHVESWATELLAGATADHYVLLLVGPCSQSVVEMQSFQGVSVPCPKSLDIDGLLFEAAHVLDKFLERESLDRRSATQRELMVYALTTRLSAYSSDAKTLSRTDLIALLQEWISAISGLVDSAWEQVSFERQRGIENAVAGKTLGPSDVDACPEFAICNDIVAELNRSHFYEVVGTPGCGKSITGWHVARRFHRTGFSVWRPRPSAHPQDLMASIPRSPRVFLVVDDAHQFGRSFAERLSECSGADTRVLLISTVQEALQSRIICISPDRCVEQLANELLNRRDEILPIIQEYDDRVGNSYGDMSFEERVRQARKESKPWEFFWVLRGGWQTARREFESVKQFAHSADVLFLIAVGQIASCDAGVPYDWILQQARRASIGSRDIETAVGYLHRLGHVLRHDSIRTKHISYASRIVEESFRQSNILAWPRFSALFLDSILGNGWSLKGVAWSLDSIRHSDAFRWSAHGSFQALVEPLTERCIRERDDIDWAAGCLSRLFSSFEIETEEIFQHRCLVLDWAMSRCGLVSLFCSNIISAYTRSPHVRLPPGTGTVASRAAAPAAGP
jgi:hypothetical protein